MPSGDNIFSGVSIPDLQAAKGTFSGQYASTKHTVSTASNAVFDWDTGNVQYYVMSSGDNGKFVFNNPKDGGRYLIVLKQPASSAAGTVTWPDAVLWPGGTAPTLTVTNSKVDIISLVYDGTNSKYYAGINQNY
jgi:hypothetical protein